MKSKSSTDNRNSKPLTITSLQSRISNLPEPVILGSRQPGYGFLVPSKSLREPEPKFKISTSKANRNFSATDIVRSEIQYRVENSMLEIVEKELTTTVGNLEDRNKEILMLRLDLERLQGELAEMNEVMLSWTRSVIESDTQRKRT